MQHPQTLVTFTLRIFWMRITITCHTTSHPEIKTGLRPEVYNMLDKQSQNDYDMAMFYFNDNVENNIDDFRTVINYLFYVLEYEFIASIVQWMRWRENVHMPENFNKLVENMEIFFEFSHFNSVNLNKKYLGDNGYEWQAPTFGDVCRPLIEYLKKFNCQPFSNCIVFLEECRKLSNMINHMRHCQYGPVSRDKAAAIHQHLDNLLNTYLPSLYIMKQALKGKLGPDIPKALDNIKNTNNNFTVEDYPDIAD